VSEIIVSTLQGLLAFILVLAPLVFVHEFGHFIVAKMLGIGVPVFSLGFGPRLFGFTRGGTDYRISAVPLGGYVRLAGDESDEERTGAPEEFLSRSKWERFLVFVAGATFNVILALLVIWFMFAVWGKDEVQSPESYPWIVVLQEGSEAERAGLQKGDMLLEIGGQDLKGYENFGEVYNREVLLSPNTTKAVLVNREGQELALSVKIGADEKFGHGLDPGWDLSWGGDETPLIAEVVPGARADEAGLQAGDLVLSAAGREPISERQFRRLLEASPEKELALRVEREDGIVDITVVPRDEEGKGKIGAMIGLPTVHRDLSLTEAFDESLRVNLSNSVLLFEVLKRMVTREVPLKSVSGPIGIAQYARRALFASPQAFIWLLGFFSLQLGILNLLPIPVLDGGHILILMVEGVLRRDLSDRLKERVMQVGFVFLLAFMSVVIVLDIVKL
jgi:regulator of sigma E protease